MASRLMELTQGSPPGSVAPSEIATSDIATSDSAEDSSLAEMIAEFGSPPKNILDRWCEQLRPILSPQDIHRLDPADLQTWTVGADGALKRIANDPSAITPANPASTSNDDGPPVLDSDSSDSDPSGRDTSDKEDSDKNIWIDQFRLSIARLAGESAATTTMVSETAVADSPDPPATLALASDSNSPAIEPRNTRPAKSSRRQSKPSKRTIGIVVVSSISLGLIAWLMWPEQGIEALAKRDLNGDAVPTDQTALDLAKSPDNKSNAAAGPALLPSQASSPSLQTFQTPSVITTESPDDLRQQLDAIAPNIETTPSIVIPEPTPSPNLDNESPGTSEGDDAAINALMQGQTPEPQIDPPPQDLPNVELKDLQESGGPRESPQKSDPTPLPNTIDLFAAKDAGEPIEIASSLPKNLAFEFVSEASGSASNPVLRIVADGEDWKVMSSENLVAVISKQDQSVGWRWIDPPKSGSRLARSIANGRLRWDERFLYLRASIVAEPFAFGFKKSDIKPAWDLMAPVDNAKTSLDASIALPEPFELSWIEPLVDVGLPGGRAIGIITSSDQEGAAIGFRMDIRGGRRISIRVRFAGRLGSNLPWMLLSHARLDQIADGWTNYGEAVSREAIRLDGVDQVAYQIGGRRGKQIIAEKIRRNNIRIKDAGIAQRRIADLKGMMIELENSAKIHLELRTHWPNEQQMVLTTNPNQTK